MGYNGIIGIKIDKNAVKHEEQKPEQVKADRNPYIKTAALIGLLNILFYNNYIVSLGIVIIEITVLAYLFLKNNITKYLGYYLIFLCLSLEFSQLVGNNTFYGFKNFRIIGINLGILTLIPIVIRLFLCKINILGLKKFNPNIYKFSYAIIFLFISGIIIGLFNILINDNNVTNIPNYLKIFIGEAYDMMAIPILFTLSFIYLLLFEKEKIIELKKFIIAILLGIVCSMITALITGTYGYYGGVKTLLVTTCVYLVPFMIYIPFYKNIIKSKLFILFSFLGVVLTLIYNSNGKIILVSLAFPFIGLIVLWKQRNKLKFLLFLSAIPLIIIIAIFTINNISANNILFNSKFNEVISMLHIWDPNWFINMPMSPRFRIIEFVNVTIELLRKPWYMPFGKGFMGTITDHMNMLTYIPGAFSDEQWINGTFYALHMVPISLFLSNGLLGILLFCFVFKQTLKYSNKSFWVLIGGGWFVLYFGFSITLSALGICCLLLGFYDIDYIERRIDK